MHHESQCATSCITFVCAYVLRLAPIDTAAYDDSGGTVGKNCTRRVPRRGSSLTLRGVSTMLTHSLHTHARAPLIARRVFDILNYPVLVSIVDESVVCTAVNPRLDRRIPARQRRLRDSFFFHALFCPFHAAKLSPQQRTRAVRNNLIHYARLPRLAIFNATIRTRERTHTRMSQRMFSYLM